MNPAPDDMKSLYVWIILYNSFPTCLPEIHEDITHLNLHRNQDKQKTHSSKRRGTNLSPQKPKYSKCLYRAEYQVVEEITSLIKLKPNIQITYQRYKGKWPTTANLLHTQSNFWVSEETKLTILPVVVLANAALLSLNTYDCRNRQVKNAFYVAVL